MVNRKQIRRYISRLFSLVVLIAILAACAPEGQTQETIPALTQTIAATSTAEILETATPENTPTTEATSTPEATATPEPHTQGKEFPSDLIINERYLVEKGNLPFTEWGDGYSTRDFRIVIRSQDVHRQSFSMLNGRYHVIGWADAWFQERNGTGHHISVPLLVFDTENIKLWTIVTPYIEDWPQANDSDRDLLLQLFTEPWNQSDFAKWYEEQMCFTPTGDRDCGNEWDQSPYMIAIGHIPTQNIDSRMYRENLQKNVEFWRDLLEDTYTQDNVEAFWQTFDPSSLQLDQPNLPPNFLIPLRGD